MNEKILNTQLEGFYKIAIVNPATGEEKWQTDDWNKNLILNQGMDHIAADAITEQFLVAKSGAGSRPNSISGLSSQITQSGTSVYMSVRTGLADFTSSISTYAAAAQVGDMIVYANASQSQITSVTDGFNLQVTPSYTITSGQTFVIWKTSQTTLQSPISNSSGLFVGAGDGTYAGTTTAVNVRTHKRSWNFPVETSQTTYNELGVGWTTSNLFSRMVLDPPLIIDAGLQLRLLYALQTTWTPAAEVYKTASIGNWPVAPATNTLGSESLQVLNTSYINTSDATSNFTMYSMLDPYYITETVGITTYNFTVWGSTSTASLASFGNFVNRSAGSAQTTNASLASYTNGNYYIDKTATFSTAQLISNAIGSIGIGLVNSSDQSYAFRFNQTQSKSAIQTLSFTFRYNWTRTLA